ncbi:carboxylesterase/lipase family protein [Telluria beijingensis]|uniref:carboxylesterase/lipase family protein n=1 Tax=Telluria beijingensis TaxID=3068633 RepID=UPI0027956DBF|nr:carboxylesterase family protein [Massilia sp. REN29]
MPYSRFLAVLFATSTLVLPPALAAAAGPLATIDSGKVEGKVDGGIASWKGIPFAAPPVGALRWRAPQAVALWSGVRQATAYAPDCMQLPFPSDAAPLGTQPDEDCLYLNVWKPADAGARLPVLVWIYGGGFVNGGSSPPTYSGAELAKQGVVVISFNYRIGRFGFFAHPQLTREAGAGEPLGNYGFMDQVAALQWIKRNAAAFGGDPANVTITGESAGGMSVNALLTSPMSAGLFAKAVVMSGGDGGTAPTSLADVEKIGQAFATGKGIAHDDPQALDKLRALPAEQVVDGMNLATFRQPAAAATYHGPFVDGKVAIDSGAAFGAGRMHRVPVMIGATSADIGGNTGYMVAGARSLAATLADHGVPVYAYRFSYVADSIAKPGAGAGHATDIPYFFDTVAVKYGAAASARDVAMGKAMATYMVNFAKRGDPNGAGLPAWPRYARSTDQLMDFAAGGKPVALKDPWGTEIDAAQKAR